MKFWQCSVCKYIHEGDTPPEKCPVCGVDSSKFIEIDEKDIPENKRKPPTETTAPESEPVEKTAIPPEDKGPTDFRGKVEALLVKHHAHPVTVHTPNGVLPMTVILYILAWLSGSVLLAKSAMISQVFVIAALPVVIFTGTLEWRQKYNAAMTPVFKLKILAAALTSATCIITLAWYLIDPGVVHSAKAWIFILINVLMLGCAGIAGHIGGKLVFKD